MKDLFRVLLGNWGMDISGQWICLFEFTALGKSLFGFLTNVFVLNLKCLVLIS